MEDREFRLDSSLVRDIHTRLLLSAIREKASTRTELAKVTGLSLPTVGAIVNSLSEEGYIVNERLGEYGGGRKPMVLRFVPTARYIVGVNLGGSQTQAVLADLNGSFVSEIVSGSSADLESDVSGSIINLIEQLRTENNLPWHLVVGIGVSVRGCFDTPNGYYFFPGKQEGHLLQDDLEEHFRIPVILERNANAAALSERERKYSAGVKDLIFINVDKGISSGLILGGRLYRGFLGNAGEFGHVIVDSAGPVCPDCGQRGCLETIASIGGLVGNAEGAGVEFPAGSNTLERLVHLVSLARQGHDLANACFKRAEAVLGQAIVSLVNIINPNLLVLGGNVIWCYPEIVDNIAEFVFSSCWPYSRQGLRFEIATEDKHVFLHGAVTLILDRLFVKHKSRFMNNDNAAVKL